MPTSTTIDHSLRPRNGPSIISRAACTRRTTGPGRDALMYGQPDIVAAARSKVYMAIPWS